MVNYITSLEGVRMVPAAKRIWSVTVCLLFVGAWGGSAFAEDYLDYFERGELALRVQKWDRAIELFSKAVKDNPKFYPAYRNRAIAYSKTGEYDKSIKDLQKAVQINPDYPEAYGLMGVVFEIKKDYASALKAYQRALKLEKRVALKEALGRYIKDVKSRMRQGR